MTVFKEIKDIDHNRILTESTAIIDSVGWNNCQICLQYSSIISWHNDIDEYGKTRTEYECNNFHPDLNGTYIQQVLTDLDFPVASARLMFLHERNCYSTHVDLYTRYHIPVVNNSRLSFMVFPDVPYVAFMPKGKIYWTDTHKLHNFVNGDHAARIHLIFNNANERPNYDNPYIKELHGDRFT